MTGCHETACHRGHKEGVLGGGALHDDFTFMQKAEVNTSEAKTYSPRILFTSPEGVSHL